METPDYRQIRESQSFQTLLASRAAIQQGIASSAEVLTAPPRRSQISDLTFLNEERRSYAEGAKRIAELEKKQRELEASELKLQTKVQQMRRGGNWIGPDTAFLRSDADRRAIPRRNLTHRDFHLKEMAWLSNEFRAEKQWKVNACNNLSQELRRHFAAKQIRDERNERDRSVAMQRRAKWILNRVIDDFWGKVARVITHVGNKRQEVVRRRLLKKRQNELLDQTAHLTLDIQASLVGGPTSSSSVDADGDAVMNDGTVPPPPPVPTTTTSAPSGGPVEEIGVASVTGDLERAPTDAEKRHGEEMVDRLDKLGLSTAMENATRTADELQPKGFTLQEQLVQLEYPTILSQTPTHTLRDYQFIGLNWLAMMHKKGLNGILADEMGLGKTIQAIALLSYLVMTKQIWGQHLIVVPSSVILNWEVEFKRWCPYFKVLSYYGTAKQRREKRRGWNNPDTWNICITSYAIVTRDCKAFRRKQWQYLILDEAQNIKNYRSRNWQILLTFKTKSRLLLTGTPLQNSLMELWALMHFLMPSLFESHSEFQEWFSNPVEEIAAGRKKMDRALIARLHKILRPFILRRMKKDVEKQMPSKTEEVISCQLSKRQRGLYEEFMQRSNTRQTLLSGNVLKILNVLMQLRKVCNHPDLFKERDIISSFDQEEDALVFPAVSFGMVQNLFDPSFEGCDLNHVNLSYMGLRFIQNEFLLTKRVCIRIRDTATPRFEFLDTVESGSIRFKNVLAGSTGAGCNPAVFQSYSLRLRRQFLDESRKSRLQAAEMNSVAVTRHVMYGCDLLDCFTFPHRMWRFTDDSRDIESFTFGRDIVKTPEMRFAKKNTRALLQHTACVIPPARARPPQPHWIYEAPTTVPNDDFVDDCLRSLFSSSLSIYRKVHLRLSIFFPDKRLIEFDCGKLQVLGRLLRNLRDEKHRVLIFTQMGKVLDVLERFLCLHGFTYFRLDGSTAVEERQYLTEKFNSTPEIFAFISSTRAGGLGINLTGADRVVFYDSDWNPAMDAQAQDRCHRIGQTKDVVVYRLITQHTIEEKILEAANRKRKVNEMVITQGCFTPDFFRRLDVNDFFDLQSVEAEQEQEGEGEVRDVEMADADEEAAQHQFSEQEVESMLRRAEDDEDRMALDQAKAEIDQGENDDGIDVDVNLQEEKILNSLSKMEKKGYYFLIEHAALMEIETGEGGKKSKSTRSRSGRTRSLVPDSRQDDDFVVASADESEDSDFGDGSLAIIPGDDSSSRGGGLRGGTRRSRPEDDGFATDVGEQVDSYWELTFGRPRSPKGGLGGVAPKESVATVAPIVIPVGFSDPNTAPLASSTTAAPPPQDSRTPYVPTFLLAPQPQPHVSPSAAPTAWTGDPSAFEVTTAAFTEVYSEESPDLSVDLKMKPPKVLPPKKRPVVTISDDDDDDMIRKIPRRLSTRKRKRSRRFDEDYQDDRLKRSKMPNGAAVSARGRGVVVGDGSRAQWGPPQEAALQLAYHQLRTTHGSVLASDWPFLANFGVERFGPFRPVPAPRDQTHLARLAQPSFPPFEAVNAMVNTGGQRFAHQETDLSLDFLNRSQREQRARKGTVRASVRRKSLKDLVPPNASRKPTQHLENFRFLAARTPAPAAPPPPVPTVPTPTVPPSVPPPRTSAQPLYYRPPHAPPPVPHQHQQYRAQYPAHLRRLAQRPPPPPHALQAHLRGHVRHPAPQGPVYPNRHFPPGNASFTFARGGGQ